MDRQSLERHLAEAEEHIAVGKRSIDRQREIIAERQRHGHDTFTALKLLKAFEELQRLHIQDREMVARGLVDLAGR